MISMQGLTTFIREHDYPATDCGSYVLVAFRYTLICGRVGLVFEKVSTFDQARELLGY